MRILHRLAELSMSLAELAAEDAASAEPDPAEPAQPSPAAWRPRSRTEHILAFTRVSRIATAAIALHATLEAGPARPQGPARQGRAASAEKPPGDVRRKFLQESFVEAALRNPDHQIDPAQACQCLEAHLADPEHAGSHFSVLFAQVMADLGHPEIQPGPVHANLFECFEREDEQEEESLDWLYPTSHTPPDD